MPVRRTGTAGAHAPECVRNGVLRGAQTTTRPTAAFAPPGESNLKDRPCLPVNKDSPAGEIIPARSDLAPLIILIRSVSVHRPRTLVWLRSVPNQNWTAVMSHQ